MRDISIFVPREVRVNGILEEMQNASVVLLDDVDLIDFYEDPSLKEERKSLTFRLVFQADDRTLTDDEVGIELAKIIQVLEEKFDAEIR
jgi:phenylalanyl-tRNA synthetase beta chain